MESVNTQSFVESLKPTHGAVEQMADDMWSVGPHIVGYDPSRCFLTVYAVHDFPLSDQEDDIIVSVLEHMNRYPATKTVIMNGYLVISHETFTSTTDNFDHRFTLIEMALFQAYNGLLKLIGVAPE